MASLHASHLTLHVFLSPLGEPKGASFGLYFCKDKKQNPQIPRKNQKICQKAKETPYYGQKGQNILFKKNKQVNLQLEINTKIHKQ